MKSKVLFFVTILLSSALFAQNSPPVAVNDTVITKPGKRITVPVVSNDYDPEGDSFKVFLAPDSDSFTDSTITYTIPYDYVLNQEGVISFNYTLVDETFNTGPESKAKVIIHVEDKFYDYLDINNINARINSFGNQFLNPHNYADSIHYEFPKGSGINSVYCSSLWIGGVTDEDTLVAADRYHFSGGDFWSGPLSVNNGTYIDTVTVENWRKVWKVNREEVIYHANHWNEPGYEAPASITAWPAHGDTTLHQSFYLAPFVDTDQDGIYQPSQGDFPLVRGDQCIFFIFNDQKENKFTGSEPIGLEVHGMAWAFHEPALPEASMEDFPSLNNTVFLSYKVFNHSSSTLTDAYIGVFSDFDLGYAFDDYVGCDVERGAFYGYNGDDYDESVPGNAGYGDVIPAQAIVILGGPDLDSDGLDNPDDNCDASVNGIGFGDGIADNERYGMSSFIYFNNATGSQSDPQNAHEYYNYMKAIWRDGTVMEYGGNGHVSSGAYGPECRFMFPGLSDSCNWGTNGIEPFGPKNWTEELADNIPGDRRGLSAMGPFTFNPGEVQKIDVAFVTAIDGTEPPVELLKHYIDTVKSFYYSNPDNFGYEWLDVEETTEKHPQLGIYPNPAIDFIYVKLDKQFKTDGEYFVYNLVGKNVMHKSFAGTGEFSIDISNLEPGFYLLSVLVEEYQTTGKFIRK
ncbi:MAG: T9SS type A sorting domain-containing protein [Bacteroidales bacterium]|nr:T9SS type A sorting domain-containing protein [Bacteroidales bacterium]MCF8397284.1 T9SS type A sorting domain-containing protein [Bacteroidales bacterium]